MAKNLSIKQKKELDSRGAQDHSKCIAYFAPYDGPGNHSFAGEGQNSTYFAWQQWALFP